jgi:hypothetical protein
MGLWSPHSRKMTPKKTKDYVVIGYRFHGVYCHAAKKGTCAVVGALLLVYIFIEKSDGYQYSENVVYWAGFGL